MKFNWIQGQEYLVQQKQLRCSWHYLINGEDTLVINGSLAKHNAEILKKHIYKVEVNTKGPHFTLEYETEGVHRISASFIKGSLEGELNLPDGSWEDWNAQFLSQMETEENRQEAKEEEVGEIWYPNIAYGWTEKPKQENILFRNATIWTNEKEGIFCRC